MDISENTFKYVDCRFADIQMLRYRLKDFDKLSPKQKIYIYYLSKATQAGRDIYFDQNGKYNLTIRILLENIYNKYSGDRSTEEFCKFREYLYRVWFSSGIYHHYSCDKFLPLFSRDYLRQLAIEYGEYQRVADRWDEICDIMFNPDSFPKRVNQSKGEDVVVTSACNYYSGVTQEEVETYYNTLKKEKPQSHISWGLNTIVTKESGRITEKVWSAEGIYKTEINTIISYLQLASSFAENDQQKDVIAKLIKYYRHGDLDDFDQYSIEWVKSNEGTVDFINGFIEVYGDPLGMKGSWEGIVEYIDIEATQRTETISKWASWFEDHSPVDKKFKREEVKGVSAKVVCAAMLGGEEYPASAIGINLPNANWIRSTYGSKSVTIGNLTEAYYEASKGNGFMSEFISDSYIINLINKYGHLADDLHTDLHECLGHGSGKLLPSTDPDALKVYGNTIEEARADLFALYYMADEKMVELSLLPNNEAYKANYYSYLLNGLMTQLVRIDEGKTIEEAHMRNRALIARWAMEHSEGCIKLSKTDGKTYLIVNNYDQVRGLFADLLHEIQRIKSEGDYIAARDLVETYAVNIEPELHHEIKMRYQKLNIAPYRGFINPRFTPIFDDNNQIIDIKVDYNESYEHQMMRYSGLK